MKIEAVWLVQISAITGEAFVDWKEIEELQITKEAGPSVFVAAYDNEPEASEHARTISMFRDHSLKRAL
jgi:hypothetical protein